MDDSTKNKLTRYLINAFPFMWGISQGNKGVTFKWLRTQGVEIPSDKYNYRQVTETLLSENIGIEKVIFNLVIPKVHEQFSPEQLNFFRDHWRNGRVPEPYEMKDLFTLKFGSYYIYQPIFPFIEIRYVEKYKYEKWGTFAGMWFEEIETLRK